ncbi:MAG TPA: hypothetical protein PLW65_07250 [Pseudomonadota bacterium]|nr:hypothetical protein [Pseudomonadota bacterium]
METTTTSQPAAHLQLNAQALLAWLRSQLTEAKTQWHTLPATLQTVWGQARTQLRSALDVPTREELQLITARVDELNAKLAALTAAPPPAAESPAQTAVAEPVPASAASPKPARNGEEKRSRKH